MANAPSNKPGTYSNRPEGVKEKTMRGLDELASEVGGAGKLLPLKEKLTAPSFFELQKINLALLSGRVKNRKDEPESLAMERASAEAVSAKIFEATRAKADA
jgi:hypothetical protein